MSLNENQDGERLDYLQELIRNCPHAQITFCDDPDCEEGAIGFMIRIEGCQTFEVCALTLREVIDKDIAAHSVSDRGGEHAVRASSGNVPKTPVPSLTELLDKIERRFNKAKQQSHCGCDICISQGDVPALVKALRYYREQFARSTDEMTLFYHDHEVAQIREPVEQPEKTASREHTPEHSENPDDF